MKFQTAVIFIMVSFVFLLAGCQSAPDEPIDVVIVGDEVNEEEQETDTTKWEYLELDIWCDEYEEDELPCWMWEDFDNSYPSRMAVLNEYGAKGWEVIAMHVSSEYNLYFWLKRPITP